MKLISIRLENFQGIKRAEFHLNGGDATIYGDNATGKTTVYNAFTWLLFNKAGNGAANYTPKPKDSSGEDVHNIENIVEAQLDIDGSFVVLKKIHKENWVRKNGEATSEFKGNTTLYFKDGICLKESEFKDYINAIVPEYKAKILTNIHHFSEALPWQERREILFNICGEISDRDIIAANPSLSNLPKILGNHTVEQYRLSATSKCKKINQELEIIPARIDEAQKATPDITGLTIDEIDNEIQLLEAEKAEKLAIKADMRDKELIAGIRMKIADLEAELSEKKRDYINGINAENNVVYEKINGIKLEISQLAADALDKERESERFRIKADEMRRERERLKITHDNVKAEKWNGSLICPTCERPFESHTIDKARTAFEDDKKMRADAIIAKVKESYSKPMEAEADIKAAELKKEAAVKKDIVERLKKDQNILRANITPNDFESSECALKIKAQISELRNQMANTAEAEAVALRRYDNQIHKINEKLDELAAHKANFAIKETQEKRIKELCEREKELARQFEALRYGLNLCENFIRIKAETISRNVCAKFKNVSFALFKNQINGGLQEICEVMVPSEEGSLVPFAFANNAGRINAGIEIISELSKYWGIYLPLFIDNRESVTRLIEADTQIISLVVSENDKVLRLEAIERGNRYVA